MQLRKIQSLDFSGMRSITSWQNCRRENPTGTFSEITKTTPFLQALSFLFSDAILLNPEKRTPKIFRPERMVPENFRPDFTPEGSEIV